MTYLSKEEHALRRAARLGFRAEPDVATWAVDHIASLRAQLKEAKGRLQFIQDVVETIELVDYSDDVQDGRVWRINDDVYYTDNLNDAIDAAMGGEES